MTKNPMTFKTNEAFMRVVEVMTDKRITTVPIVNLEGTVVGLFTEVGIIKAAVLHQGKNPSLADPIGNYTSHFEKATWVGDDENIANIIVAMVKSATHRVLVGSETQGRLHGIISPQDIVRELLSIQGATGFPPPGGNPTDSGGGGGGGFPKS